MNMTDLKNKFIGLLSTNLSIFDIKTQEEILSKMKDKWIDEYFFNISKDYRECDNCKRYHLKSDYTEEKVEELRKDVFLDCPLDPNDPDEVWGDAIFEVTYWVCPNCGHKEEIKKTELKVLRFYYV